MTVSPAALAPLYSSSIGDLPSFSQLLNSSDLNLSEAITPFPITTVGAGTLVAAGLSAGSIVRTGPVAAYTDTLDTVANILAAEGGWILNGGFQCIFKNATQYQQTIAASTGITLPATVIIGPWQVGIYSFVYGGTLAAPTITVYHLSTGSIADSSVTTAPQISSLTTVSSTVLTAAAIAGGIVLRGGSQSNTSFNDTTDTAANIIAANPALVGKVGATCLFYYQNTTNATATLIGGTGVNSAGTIDTVSGNCSALYQILVTGAATLTMTLVAKSNVPTAPCGTVVSNGASAVVVADTRITANSIVLFTLKTSAGSISGAPYISSIGVGTGFSFKSQASDTSTYNYTIIN